MRLRLRLSRDLVCQQAVELVTDYLEGALPARQLRRFEAHLAGCANCTEYLAQMRTTIALTGTLTVGDLTPEMRAEFIALYQRWRAEADRNGDLG
jgi:anti-sigma factor RsiW